MYTSTRSDQLKFKLLPYIERAYVMESHMLKMLEQHADQFANFPDVHAKLSHYVEETEHHLAHMEQLLKAYNEQPPVVHVTAPFSFLKGTPIGAIEEVLPNTLTRNLFDAYFFTHFEIATFTLLDTMARVFGDERSIFVAEEIVIDKSEMQRWLLENLPEITLRSLDQEGISVPQNAWEFAKEPQAINLVGTITSFSSCTAPL